MFDQVLKQTRQRVELLQYIMTLHSDEEMEDDGLTIFDIEHVILTGEIVQRQFDVNSGEAKYLIEGRIESGDPVIVVVKLGATDTVVIITVYRVYNI